MKRFVVLLTLMMLFISQQVFAANILFVSDNTTDSNIPTVLTGAGHSVTVVTNDYNSVTQGNPTLQGNLSMYDSVFWSATGTGSGDVHAAATFTNLSTYVSGGGNVFVTGYDTVASPPDPNLLAFIGGVASTDGGAPSGAAINIANYLTTGVVDIRGITPTGGHSDMDTVYNLLAGTIGVVPSTGGGGDGYVWTLRSLGSGFIAYVSNGANLTSGADPHVSWTNTSPGGDGAYNAALRNFAFNAGGARQVAVPTMTEWGLILLVVLAGLAAVVYLRRYRKAES